MKTISLTKRVQFGRYMKMHYVILVDNKIDKDLTEKFKELDCKNIDSLTEDEIKILKEFYLFSDDEDEKIAMIEQLDEAILRRTSLEVDAY